MIESTQPTTMLEQRSFDSIVFPGSVSRTALELRPDLTAEEWLEAGKVCALVEGASRWWIGDWLNYGERRPYGEVYQRALALFDLEYDSLAKCKYVAQQIEIFRRRKNLSWSHHLEVAHLSPDEQDEWLARAEEPAMRGEPKWTREELRRRIQGPKPLPEPGSSLLGDSLLLRFCQVDLPTPVIITLILRVAFPDARTALDTTYGNGNFWDGSAHVDVTAHDAREERAPHGAADFTDLQYGDGTFDVVLFDPPHVADAGKQSLMGNRYGTYSQEELEQVIRAGSKEAWRVSRLGIIVKVTDHSHDGGLVLETDWVRESLEGVRLYDVVYQVRSGALIDPRWDVDRQVRAFNNGSTYLVFRKVRL